jgi:hypothetical protein
MDDEEFWDKLIIGLVSNSRNNCLNHEWISENGIDKKDLELFVVSVKRVADRIMEMRTERKHEDIKRTLES